jgi:hypothetical protein
MNDDVRELVSAVLAIAYAAVLFSRSTDLPAISLKQSVSVPQAFHAMPRSPLALVP